MKQTSIEWLVEQLKQYDFSEDDGMYFIKIPSWLLKEKEEEAKQMHKEEIESAFNNGMVNSEDWFTDATTEEAEAYYQETYGSSPKTSDN